jgi:hypothetical protein
MFDVAEADASRSRSTSPEGFDGTCSADEPTRARLRDVRSSTWRGPLSTSRVDAVVGRYPGLRGSLPGGPPHTSVLACSVRVRVGQPRPRRDVRRQWRRRRMASAEPSFGATACWVSAATVLAIASGRNGASRTAQTAFDGVVSTGAEVGHRVANDRLSRNGRRRPRTWRLHHPIGPIHMPSTSRSPCRLTPMAT